jgi:hypothetical protein
MSNMTDVVLSNSSETRELTIDELDAAGGGMLMLFFALGFGIGYTAAAWAAS